MKCINSVFGVFSSVLSLCKKSKSAPFFTNSIIVSVKSKQYKFLCDLTCWLCECGRVIYCTEVYIAVRLLWGQKGSTRSEQNTAATTHHGWLAPMCHNNVLVKWMKTDRNLLYYTLPSLNILFHTYSWISMFMAGTISVLFIYLMCPPG